MTSGLIRQVVILVGGKGTRLGDITHDTPKPMLPIAGGPPFLDYLVEWIARHGYEEILLLAGHLGDQAQAAYDGRRVGDARVRVLREPTPLGTGGALTMVGDALEETFILMNGDALFDINLRALEQTARQTDAWATLALRAVPDAARYGRVLTDHGAITAFLEKDPRYPGPGIINGGVYVLKRDILRLIDSLPCSIEQHLFPELVRRAAIVGQEFEGYFLDIGLPESLDRGHLELPRVRERPAVFLDRDGVINYDEGYTHKIEDLQFIAGAPEAIRSLNDLGYYVFVVTNQAGVARGYYGLEAVAAFHAEIQRRLAYKGAHVDRFYVAPYHPAGTVPEFTCDHFDRKPNPGMLLQAMQEWPVRKQQSFLIGDHASDLEAAQRAGVRGYLFQAQNLSVFLERILRQA